MRRRFWWHGASPVLGHVSSCPSRPDFKLGTADDLDRVAILGATVVALGRYNRRVEEDDIGRIEPNDPASLAGLWR